MTIVNTKDNFKAGKIKHYINKWKNLTKDRWILQTVCGYKVELIKKPNQTFIPKPILFKDLEKQKMCEEINRFLKCNIIEKVSSDDENEYISNVFPRKKKDGNIRIILNLKKFNEDYMDAIHFKMETLQSAIDSMRRNCYFGSVDLSEAFYSIPIRKADRKFFRFYFNGLKYQFTCLVMGLATAPRVFTKILKPVFATLRARGFVSTSYIDDSCLQGSTYESCLHNITSTVSLMDSLGLTVHKSKSVLVPSKQIVFLGFVLCSETMTITLTIDRKTELLKCISDLLEKSKCPIRKFAQVIGKMVAAEPAVAHAPLFYKPLEKIKETQLRKAKGNFDHFMPIPQSAVDSLNWWLEYIPTSYKSVLKENPEIILFTDASSKGWGAFNKTKGTRTAGNWSTEEQTSHINILELKACQLALHSLCKENTHIHIQIYMDNTTSVSYINKYGGKTPVLNDLAREIWLWCLERKVTISAAHLPGKINQEADTLSRSFNDDLEWSLCENIFLKILNTYPLLRIDLFASRLNKKLDNYISLRPEPTARAVDAFTLSWSKDLNYIFPPFSLMGKILQKIVQDSAEAVVIAPIWPTQTWWASLIHMITGPCYLLPQPQDILHLPHKPDQKHPLKKMRIGVFRLSGKHSNVEMFHQKQGKLSYNHGDSQLGNSMTAILKNGYISVDKIKIPFTLL